MNTPLEVGIVGCGGMGGGHLKAILSNPGFKLAAVCDVNPAAFDAVPKEVRRYGDAAEMFAGQRLDLATIVLPNYLYEPTVQLAADHGVNVLCEKPLGHNLGSCHRIIETARRQGIRGWVSSQRKYMTHFIAARERLAAMSIDFASVIFTYYWAPAFAGMGWRGDLQKSGGIAIIDSGWHVFDALYWIMGNPVSVFAQTSASRTAPGIDEKAAIQLRYPSGALANLTISYTVPQNTFEFLFTDQNKAVVITYDSLRCFDGGKLVESLEPDKKVEVMETMYSELLAAAEGEKATPYITSFEQAEEIMTVIDACYRSAATGEVVKLGSGSLGKTVTVI